MAGTFRPPDEFSAPCLSMLQLPSVGWQAGKQDLENIRYNTFFLLCLQASKQDVEELTGKPPTNGYHADGAQPPYALDVAMLCLGRAAQVRATGSVPIWSHGACATLTSVYKLN